MATKGNCLTLLRYLTLYACTVGASNVFKVELSQSLRESLSTTSNITIRHSPGGGGARRAKSETIAKSMICNVPYPVYPISFSFPLDLMVHHKFVLKKRVVAIAIPGKKETYIHRHQEDYYWGYTTALFGLTWKKAGWDCMRHYEILGSGAIPYMPDIADLPHGTMFRFPDKILRQILHLPGVNHTAIIAGELDNDAQLVDGNFDIVSYERLLNKLLSHAKESLSTVGMANYLLSTARIGIVNSQTPPKILFLAHEHADYQADSLFHGLRTLYGKQVIDYPKRHWMYRKHVYAEQEKYRNNIYGKGFSYAFTLPDIEVERSQIEAQILQHAFDLIIYGVTHTITQTKTDESHMYFLESVKQAYFDNQVIFVDGSDTGASETNDLFSKVCGRHGVCFRRELVCS